MQNSSDFATVAAVALRRAAAAVVVAAPSRVQGEKIIRLLVLDGRSTPRRAAATADVVILE